MNEELEIDVLERLIKRCNECKLNQCENCEINWTEVQAIYSLLERYKVQRRQLNDAFDRGWLHKDKIRERLNVCKKVYEEEMKPYQREYGLDVTYLSKKEKEELINKRNCLHTQMKTYEMLLEGE